MDHKITMYLAELKIYGISKLEITVSKVNGPYFSKEFSIVQNMELFFFNRKKKIAERRIQKKAR